MKYGLGLVHIITGNGKGKSTSSVGISIRALGHNYKVLYCQFFKFQTGEKVVMEKLPNLKYMQFQVPSDFFKNYNDEYRDKAKARFVKFWQQILDAIKEEHYDIVVMDEVVYALHMELAPSTILTTFIEKFKPKNTELVLTGRDYPQEILDLADYVSEIQLVKHPFYDKRIEARKGIEF